MIKAIYIMVNSAAKSQFMTHPLIEADYILDIGVPPPAKKKKKDPEYTARFTLTYSGPIYWLKQKSLKK